MQLMGLRIVIVFSLHHLYEFVMYITEGRYNPTLWIIGVDWKGGQ